MLPTILLRKSASRLYLENLELVWLFRAVQALFAPKRPRPGGRRGHQPPDQPRIRRHCSWTISLGIVQIVAVTPADLGDRPSVSNRDYPWFTAPNGPLMARVILGCPAVIPGRFPPSPVAASPDSADPHGWRSRCFTESETSYVRGR
jgi:hypothetical protein